MAGWPRHGTSRGQQRDQLRPGGPLPTGHGGTNYACPTGGEAKCGCRVGGFGGGNEGLGSAGSGCPGLIPPCPGGFRFSPNAVRAGILPARERTLYR